MTTTAIAGGFAVCQTRLGTKVHDPKDPGADLGPMFSQVLATMLRLTEEHAERWLDVEGSHDVPVYGFERIIDPPPLKVDTGRLLQEFANGRLTVGEEWAAALDPERLAAVMRLARDAERAVEEAGRADTPSTVEEMTFGFPDEVWARVIYDITLAARARVLPIDRLVAALIPLYFGRVASLVIEARDLTTEQAETIVERQARAFELAKPQFVTGGVRWRLGPGASAPRKPRIPRRGRARRRRRRAPRRPRPHIPSTAPRPGLRRTRSRRAPRSQWIGSRRPKRVLRP